jgi:FAD/FMN-containing dehydrogenase
MGAKNVLKLGVEFLPEMWMTITGGVPKLILMADFAGNNEQEVYEKAMAAQDHLKELGLKTRVTKTAAEMKKYWTIRRESFNLLRHHIQGKHTAPFIDDLVVDPKFLPEFLPRLNKILKKYPKLIYTVAGHMGNGNFHIIPLMDLKEKDAPEIIKNLGMEVYDLVLEYHGSITGEHNDGLVRSPYLKKMYGEKVYKLFEETKKIFDPENIFNPGKKVGDTLSYSLHHLEKD